MIKQHHFDIELLIINRVKTKYDGSKQPLKSELPLLHSATSQPVGESVWFIVVVLRHHARVSLPYQYYCKYIKNIQISLR